MHDVWLLPAAAAVQNVWLLLVAAAAAAVGDVPLMPAAAADMTVELPQGCPVYKHMHMHTSMRGRTNILSYFAKPTFGCVI